MAKDFSQYKLNVIPSPPDKRDWKVASIYKVMELPAEFDLRDKLKKVRDQLSQGSCVAQAGCAMKSVQERLDANSGFIEDYMSPQFIYNNRENKDSEGMFLRDLMRILKNIGIVPESKYPYGTFDPINQELYNLAKNYVIDNYAMVSTIEELKLALYINKGAIFAVPVYNYGPRMWHKDAGDYLLGYHCMAFTKYSDINRKLDVRNSWDDDWENDGYTEMSYDDFLSDVLECWTTIDKDSFVPVPPKKKWWEMVIDFFLNIWGKIRNYFHF